MIANIALDDAMILPYDANPSRIEFSETTGASSIHGELMMLGFEVAQSTVSK